MLTKRCGFPSPLSWYKHFTTPSSLENRMFTKPRNWHTIKKASLCVDGESLTDCKIYQNNFF